MNANNTDQQGRALRLEELIRLAREIRREFAKIHGHMAKILEKVDRQNPTSGIEKVS